MHNNLFLIVAVSVSAFASQDMSKETVDRLSNENAQIFFNALRMTGIASQLAQSTPEQQSEIEREIARYRERIEQSAARKKQIEKE